MSVTHSFELMSKKSIYQRARRILRTNNEIDHKEIYCMLLAGINTPLESTRASPVVNATKNNGSPRFCVCYRNLKSVIHVNSRPLGRDDEMLDYMRGRSVFSTRSAVQG